MLAPENVFPFGNTFQQTTIRLHSALLRQGRSVGRFGRQQKASAHPRRGLEPLSDPRGLVEMQEGEEVEMIVDAYPHHVAALKHVHGISPAD